MMRDKTALGLWMMLALTACPAPEPEPEPEGWTWALPQGFPEPVVPEDNLMTEVKVELGRRLFYDKRMSGNQTQSCASCHKQELAFSDARAQGKGSTGEIHPRGAMSLTNVAYNATLTWVNPLERSLEHQALAPMFGDQPVELGMTDREDELFARIQADPVYVTMFQESFPEVSGEVSVDTITKAIAAFERTLISGNAPYDKWVRGEDAALSESARRGLDLFFSERLECFHCHGNFNFADSVTHANTSIEEIVFHNTGLYNLDALGSYPPDNKGLFEFTGVLEDMGRFRAPTLRNIEVTAPYMHDGSVETLSDALDHYAQGGRTVMGMYAGDGSANPHKSEFVQGFVLTEQEKEDVLAFLRSLTDQEFLTNPAFSDPFATTP